jgi:TRPM family ion channel/pYEATS domain-containing protein involved in immunity
MPLRIEQGFEYKGHDYWRWWISIDGPDAELDSIGKVVYKLDPSFPDPVRSVTDRATRFQLTEMGWGAFVIYADVFDQSGTLINKLEHPLELRYPDGTPTAGVTDAENAAPVSSLAAPTSRSLTFPNGRTARLVEVAANTPTRLILESLSLTAPRPVIAIIGGAGELDERVKPRLAKLFSRAVARVAVSRGALILDGGTDAGVMALMGQGAADRGHYSDLVGVAPSAKVTYPGGPEGARPGDRVPLEANHTHFVLLEHAGWGGEVGTMDALAKRLAGDAPAVTILADGGPIAIDEVVRSVRRRWPIIVLAGSGRFADQLVKLSKNKNSESVADPRLAEILADGQLHFFSATDSVEDLTRTLYRFLDPPAPDPALYGGWGLFAWLDANANAERRDFETLQTWIIRLGVLATFVALVQSQIAIGVSENLKNVPPGSLAGWSEPPWLHAGLQCLLVLVTVATTILLGAAARFKAGTRWVLLRGGAEAVKREIFRYRTAGPSHH